MLRVEHRGPAPDLTETQRGVLVFIGAYWMEWGAYPSIREIGAEFGWASTQAVMCHIVALTRKGRLVAARSRKSRSYRVAGLSDAVRDAATKHLAAVAR